MSGPITGSHRMSDCHIAAMGDRFSSDFPAASFFRQQISIAGSSGLRIGRIEKQVTSEESCVVPPRLRSRWLSPRAMNSLF